MHVRRRKEEYIQLIAALNEVILRSYIGQPRELIWGRAPHEKYRPQVLVSDDPHSRAYSAVQTFLHSGIVAWWKQHRGIQIHYRHLTRQFGDALPRGARRADRVEREGGVA
jgi:hypothetical protein